ncbi:MAG: hypothetical protein AAGF92_20800 [Myxococcota bacterium]
MTSLTWLRLVGRTSVTLTAFTLSTLAFGKTASAFDTPVVIESPEHGTFLDEDTVEVSGRVGSAFELGTTTFERPNEAENGGGNGDVQGTIAYTAEGYQGSLVANSEWYWELGCCFQSVRAELVIDSFKLDELGNAETLSGVLKATFYYDIFDIQYHEQEFPITAADIPLAVIDGSVLRIGPIGAVGGYVMSGSQFDVALQQMGAGWTVEVNGVSTPVAPNGSWSTLVALDRDAIVNPIVASGSNGVETFVDRVVVGVGDSLSDSELSPDAVAARVGPGVIEELLTAETLLEQLDLDALAGKGSSKCVWRDPIFNECTRMQESEIREAPEIRGDVEVDVVFDDEESKITINVGDMLIKAKARDTAMFANAWCNLEIETDLEITAKLDFNVDADDPYSLVLAPSAISTDEKNLSWGWTSGICDTGFWDWITQDILGVTMDGEISGEVEAVLRTEIGALLNELNVSGLVDGPLAGLGVAMDAPFKEVSVDSQGITLMADLGATSVCEPPPGAPELGASYSEVNPADSPFPAGGIEPGFNVGASVTTSAANQVLKTQIECGLLMESVEEIDIFSNETLYPTTLGFLSILIGALNDLTKSEEAGGYGMDPLTLVRIDVQPTMAPILVSGGGPNGESLGLKVPQLLIRMIDTGLTSNFPSEGTTPTGRPERLLVEAATDFEMGIDLESYGDEVGFSIGLPPSEAIAATVTGNPFHLDALSVEGVVPGLVNRFVPELLAALDTIPLPELLGEQVFLSDAYTEGEYIGVFASYGEPSITVTMNVSPPELKGQIKLGENVSGEVICDAEEKCTMKVPMNGGPVTIRAWSHTYPYFFSHWSGVCSGGNSRCTIDPSNGDVEVTAHFWEDHG